MIRKVLVYPNEKRDCAYCHTQKALSFLRSQGAETYVPSDMAEVVGAEPLQRKETLDLAIALGGDGTMIQAAHFLLGTGVPILGINLGTLGYLTEAEPGTLETSLQQVLEGRFQVESRLILEAEVTPFGHEEQKELLWAINDFVIHRNLLDGLLTIDTYVNDDFLAKFRADGVIVASPCGSTAYNFSAGGPILNPVADNLILTPLCSHAMMDRSIVLMGQDQLRFQIAASSKGKEALLSADGAQTISLSEGTWISVKKSKYTFPMVKLLQRSFYEVLQKKMRPL